MRLLFSLLAGLALALCAVGNEARAAEAGYAIVLPGGCNTATYSQGNQPVTQNTGGQQCVSASVSASISGFTATSTGTPISVTTGGNTGSLPAGAVVVATNVGATNGAYCALGGSASTSSQYLSPGGGWFAFTVGASTQLTCITSISTTTVNMTGGTGLPTGTGGGGGSGGGGAITMASGAVSSGAYSSGSIASGAFASGSVASGAFASGSLASGAGTDGWNVTEGTKADAAWSSGSGSVIAILKAIANGITGSIPAGSNIIGAVTPPITTAVSGTASTTGTTTTQLIAAQVAKVIYVTAYACDDNDGTNSGHISFQDGSGGTTIWTTTVQKSNGGANLSGGTILFKTTSGNGLYFKSDTGITTLFCNAAGFAQ